MEGTSEYGILGRHQSCSEEGIEVLSNTIDRYHSARNTPVVQMETGEVIYEKVYASRRRPLKISLKHDWMKELGSEVAQRPDRQVVQQFKSSQSSQPNPNPDHDRTGKPVVCRDACHAQGARKTLRSQEIETRSFHEEGNMIERRNPLFTVTQVTRKVPPKNVHLLTARASKLKIRQITMERRNPLFAVTQVTRKITSSECWTRWTLTSEYPDCHTLLWNKLRTLVFVNWSRRSRTTLTDNLFNEIYKNTKPTTRSVRRPRKWFRTWAT